MDTTCKIRFSSVNVASFSLCFATGVQPPMGLARVLFSRTGHQITSVFGTHRLLAKSTKISTIACLSSSYLVQVLLGPAPICSFCYRSWLITGRGIAKKIRYAAPSANRQMSELIAEARRECPNCSYVIDNSDVSTLFCLGCWEKGYLDFRSY